MSVHLIPFLSLTARRAEFKRLCPCVNESSPVRRQVKLVFLDTVVQNLVSDEGSTKHENC